MQAMISRLTPRRFIHVNTANKFMAFAFTKSSIADVEEHCRMHQPQLVIMIT